MCVWLRCMALEGSRANKGAVLTGYCGEVAVRGEGRAKCAPRRRVSIPSSRVTVGNPASSALFGRPLVCDGFPKCG